MPLGGASRAVKLMNSLIVEWRKARVNRNGPDMLSRIPVVLQTVCVEIFETLCGHRTERCVHLEEHCCFSCKKWQCDCY